MTIKRDTVLDGWKEFYEPNKKFSRFQKKLVITSVFSFGFIIMILGGTFHFQRIGTVQPILKEHTAANIFRINLVYTPEITTKLKTRKDKESILKARFSLELVSHDEKTKVNQKMHLIANQLKQKLQTYAAMDLTKTKGIENLRKELLTKINKIISPIRVNQVFIKDFIIH